MLKVNYELSTTGTFNVGILKVSFAEIVSRFGYPEIIEQPDKSRVEWVIQDENRVITIYDWKEDRHVEDVTEWNVGGRSVRDWVSVAMEFKL